MEDTERPRSESNSDFVRVSRAAEYCLKVHSPKTVNSLDGTYTSYCITFETTSPVFQLKKSRVRRRFSEFIWLRKKLIKMDNWRTPPPLPPRRFWNLQDPALIQTRQQELEKWIYTVLVEPVYLSCSALHLFLQTELTTGEIQDYLDGRIPEDTVRQVWDNHGQRHNYQPHNPLHNFVHQEPMEIHFTEDDVRSLPDADPACTSAQPQPASPQDNTATAASPVQDNALGHVPQTPAVLPELSAAGDEGHLLMVEQHFASRSDVTALEEEHQNDVTDPEEERHTQSDATDPEEEHHTQSDATDPEEEHHTQSDVTDPEEERHTQSDVTDPEEEHHTQSDATDPEGERQQDVTDLEEKRNKQEEEERQNEQEPIPNEDKPDAEEKAKPQQQQQQELGTERQRVQKLKPESETQPQSASDQQPDCSPSAEKPQPQTAKLETYQPDDPKPKQDQVTRIGQASIQQHASSTKSTPPKKSALAKILASAKVATSAKNSLSAKEATMAKKSTFAKESTLAKLDSSSAKQSTSIKEPTSAKTSTLAQKSVSAKESTSIKELTSAKTSTLAQKSVSAKESTSIKEPTFPKEPTSSKKSTASVIEERLKLVLPGSRTPRGVNLAGKSGAKMTVDSPEPQKSPSPIEQMFSINRD